jgi:biopolymer transport protein ExbD
MIDMTFQLIAFFMVLVNFSDAEQDQRIKLPSSELAKPPDAPFEEPRYVQLTKDDLVLFAGDEVPVEKLEPILQREKAVLLRNPDKSTSMVTVIIRADSGAKTGRVQELIEICQTVGFEKFALRAMAEEE